MDCMQHSSTVQPGLQRTVVEMSVFLPMELTGSSPADSFKAARLGVTALLGRQAHPLV